MSVDLKPIAPQPVAPAAPVTQESAGQRALRLALATSRVHHTLSIAQRVGIYPA